MVRRIYLLGFLAIVVTGGYSIAAKPDKHDSESKQDSKGKQEPAKAKRERAPFFCLQQLSFDMPGDVDVYVSASFYTGCENPPTEELWFGTPSLEMPQDCDLCEEPREASRAYGGMPAHHQNLNKANSWRMLQAGLEAAGISTAGMQPQWHKIPRDKLPAGFTEDVYFVAAPIPPKGLITETRYLGYQTRTLPSGQVDAATFQPAVKRAGHQLWIDYTVGAERRKGYVWLRD